MLSYAVYLVLLGTFAKCDSANNYFGPDNDINHTIRVILGQISSMDGKVHNTNDPRFQYVQIVHVVYQLGASQAECSRPDYHKTYLTNVRKHLDETVKDPKNIISEVYKRIYQFLMATKAIQEALGEKCDTRKSANPHWCDVEIQKVVDAPDFPKKQVKVFQAAGDAAISFIRIASKFDSAAKAHNAQNFLINGENEIKELVMATANYLKALNEQTNGAKC